MKINKKMMMFGIIGFFALALVSAAILNYYGQINQEFNVEQAVTLTGGACVNNVCPESLGSMFSGDTSISNVYTLTNIANTSRAVELGTSSLVDGLFCATGEVDTSYLKGYTYSAIIAEVEVDVTDEGEWLKWTYTYSATPTHTPKMTVEINYPNGFGITTFDDGSHDGWYYFTSSEEVRISDYDSSNKISGYDWVETTTSANVLTVKIKRSALGNEFEWHGFANLDGNQVWINANETGTGYSEPIFEVNMTLDNPFEIAGGDSLDFVVVNDFNGFGDYTVTTKALPA